MSDDKFPAWFYDPETKQGQVFQSADDVPDGWVETLDDALTKVEKAAPVMARKAVIAELKNGGIEFDAKANTADLYDLLKGKLMEALTAQNIEFDADASAPELLKLLG